jgi:hypothetical protein
MKQFQEVLDLDEAGVRRRLDGPDAEVNTDRRYEGLEHVTHYYNPSVLPAHVYVRNGRVQMVYVPRGSAALQDTTPADIDAQVGGRGQRVRSRAGKSSNQYVRADQGVAYSTDEDEVEFVEIFRPRSLDAYLREIYQDPGEFIK